MQAKPRRPRRRKPHSNSWLLMAVIWLPVALVLPRLLQSNFPSSESRSNDPTANQLATGNNPSGETALNRPADFENAFEAITGLSQQFDGSIQTREGISQTQYDRWRQLQGEPPQSIANLQPAEVAAIYRTYWQQGNCDSYPSPLDIACLDTMIAFGTGDGKSFLAGLSPNPQQAAIEVAQRRIAYRQRQQTPGLSGVTPSQTGGFNPDPRALMAGLARDRALQAFLIRDRAGQTGDVPVATRQFPNQNDPSGSTNPGDQPPGMTPSTDNPTDRSSPFPNWSRFTAILPDWLPFKGNKPTATLDPRTIYTNAKPYTVELWIHVDSGYAPATGIILQPNGIVLTNYHVISNNPTPDVRLPDGRRFAGKVITSDPSIDLALVQVEGASNLPTANLADNTRDIQAGDTVYAIGSPMGSHWKMTQAQVMQTDSLCGSRALDRRCIRTPTGFLQPGNSGGPLLDTQGEVIGVNRAIQESTGQGVSIPIEIVRQFITRSQP